jgi:hypothetical protein
MRLKLDADLEDIEGLVEDLAEADTEDARLAAVAVFLDAALPLGAVLPPPIGAIAEAADGILLGKLISWGVDVLKRDPNKRAERRARRKKRREARAAGRK